MHRQVKVTAEVLKRRIRLNELFGKILRVRGHEPDTGYFQRIKLRKQIRKGRSAAHIRIYVLTEQGYLLNPFLAQLPCFPYDIRLRSGALPAPYIRYDAIRTEIVAAVHDIDESGKGAGAHNGQIFLYAALFQYLDPPAALDGLAYKACEPIQIMSAEDDIHKRIHFPYPVRHTLFLRHAAPYAYQEIRLFLFQFLEPYNVSESAVFGIRPHRAGFKYHDVRFFTAGRPGIAHFLQKTGQRLSITHVHLAAVYDQVIFFAAAGKLLYSLGILKAFARRIFKQFSHYGFSFPIGTALWGRSESMAGDISYSLPRRVLSGYR